MKRTSVLPVLIMLTLPVFTFAQKDLLDRCHKWRCLVYQ